MGIRSELITFIQKIFTAGLPNRRNEMGIFRPNFIPIKDYKNRMQNIFSFIHYISFGGFVQ